MTEPAANTHALAGFSGGRPFCDRQVPLPAACIRLIAIGLFSVTQLACGSAQAQIAVEGPRDAVRIDIIDAPLHDVLGVLHTKFNNLHFRSNEALDSRKTVRMKGPLRRVVARLLDGHDFVMTTTPDGLDVLILQQNAAAGIAIAPVPPARLPPPAAPVMTAQEANRYERDRSR